MDILSSIQKKYSTFTDKERSIADYILKEGNNIRNMNISVLAATVGVSDGTITRFCKKVGQKSFAELKIQLGSAGAGNKIPHSDDLVSQVYDFYKTVIEHSNQMIDRKALEYLADQIAAAGNIYIFGVGSSGLTACETMLRLSRMGFHVQSVTDSHLMVIYSSILGPGDLVIAISISGETAEVINAVRAAKQNGAKIIGLTSFTDSTIAQCADFCFPVVNPLFVDQERFVNSQLSTLYTIDLLCLILLKDEARKKKMNITVETIVKQSHLK